MKVDFHKGLTTIKGNEPLKQKQDDGTFAEMTLEDVCVQALLSPYPDEQNLSMEDKNKRYKIAASISRTAEGEETNLKSEDVTLIKTLVAKAFAPLVVGQVIAALEGDDE